MSVAGASKTVWNPDQKIYIQVKTCFNCIQYKYYFKSQK